MRVVSCMSLFVGVWVVGFIGVAAGGQTGDGVSLWQIGKADGDTSEFALAPKDALQFSSAFKQGPVFGVGISDPKTDWPYVHPGPMDAWAGNR